MNAKPTPGPWDIAKPESYFHSRQIIVPSGDFPYLIADLREATMPKNEAEANAALVVAAVNACFQINPSNPIAVAEALPELVNELKQIMNRSRDFEFVVPRPIAEKIRAALTKAEANP